MTRNSRPSFVLCGYELKRPSQASTWIKHIRASKSKTCTFTNNVRSRVRLPEGEVVSQGIWHVLLQCEKIKRVVVQVGKMTVNLFYGGITKVTQVL